MTTFPTNSLLFPTKITILPTYINLYCMHSQHPRQIPKMKSQVISKFPNPMETCFIWLCYILGSCKSENQINFFFYKRNPRYRCKHATVTSPTTVTSVTFLHLVATLLWFVDKLSIPSLTRPLKRPRRGPNLKSGSREEHCYFSSQFTTKSEIHFPKIVYAEC